MNLSTQDLAAISDFFELGSVNKVTRLGGVANHNFLASTSKGDFVIKRVREHDADTVRTIGPLFQALSR